LSTTTRRGRECLKFFRTRADWQAFSYHSTTKKSERQDGPFSSQGVAPRHCGALATGCCWCRHCLQTKPQRFASRVFHPQMRMSAWCAWKNDRPFHPKSLRACQNSLRPLVDERAHPACGFSCCSSVTACVGVASDGLINGKKQAAECTCEFGGNPWSTAMRRPSPVPTRCTCRGRHALIEGRDIRLRYWGRSKKWTNGWDTYIAFSDLW